METACLRVRFTPLLQNIHKENSKHCLEIVPEISCIQNLDKIQWKKGENSIEYTIPMTYKIILKKKCMVDQFEAPDLVKTYHSCVDLLLPPTDTEDIINQGSGDISRIVSDSFVLSKITTDVERCNILLSGNNKNSNYDSMEFTTTQVQTELTDTSIPDQLVANEMIIANNNAQDNATSQTDSEVLQRKSVVQVPDANIFNYIESSMHKLTNTEWSATNDRGVKVSAWETVLTINSKTETRHSSRKLSLTPICSINTHDDASEPVEVITSNTLVFHVYETHNGYPYEKIHERNKSYNFCYDKNTGQGRKITNEYSCVKGGRLLPEVRVANFIRIMEKEIMPLQAMLGDILNKCSSLGFTWRKPQQSPLIYKTISHSEKQISKCLKTKAQSKSNRVVYSIVFDG